jgi:molecular chaperone Hsp33
MNLQKKNQNRNVSVCILLLINNNNQKNCKLVRAISGDGSVVCYAIDSTKMVQRAEHIHKTSAVVTAALGRLLTGASLMGIRLKGENDSLTLKLSGGGPVGSVIAVSDSGGNVKGYVTEPVVELPLNKYGKLDVSGAVGKDGTFSVMCDMGLKEPYIGQIPITSGEVAEDITSYYVISEQIPTVCALGVLVNPDLTVKAAGGFLLQVLPGGYGDDNLIEIIEKNTNSLDSVTKMLTNGMTAQDICQKVLDGLSPQILDSTDVGYICNCSRQRVQKAILSVGKVELKNIIEEDQKAEVKCHFCEKIYRFNKEELTSLLNK